MLDSYPNHLFSTSLAKWKFELADLTAISHVKLGNLTAVFHHAQQVHRRRVNLDRTSDRFFFIDSEFTKEKKLI